MLSLSQNNEQNPTISRAYFQVIRFYFILFYSWCSGFDYCGFDMELNLISSFFVICFESCLCPVKKTKKQIHPV